MTSEATSQTSPKGFSLADVFKPFQLPISKVSSSDVLKALGKFLPVIYQKGITSNQTLNCPKCPPCPEAPYHIGDFAEGGVIIWLTNDGLHGLVAAIEDTNALAWGPTDTLTNATNNDPLPFSTPSVPYGQYYGGFKNQQIIQGLASWDTKYPAFAAAADYSISVNGVTYQDWWVPSSLELLLMYTALDVINKVSQENKGSPMKTGPFDGNYWSSREKLKATAWYLPFATAIQSDSTKTSSFAVRCVRAF